MRESSIQPELLYATKSCFWLPAQIGRVFGTMGMYIPLTEFRLSLNSFCIQGGVTYRGHVSYDGWLNPVSNGMPLGNIRGNRLEALQIVLTGPIAQEYSSMYRSHVDTFGWQEWVLNGQTSGTTGIGKHIEAIEVRLVRNNCF